MKSSNTNKNTIQFKIKKIELEGSQNREHLKRDKLRFHKTSDDSHKVLEYPNKRKKGIKKINNIKDGFKSKLKGNKYLKVAFYVVLFIGLLFLLDKVFFKNGTNSASASPSSKFTAESTYISGSKASTYSSIIEESVKRYTGLSHKIKTETMHKNGDSIYATGYINSPDDGNIFFDIRLKNNNPFSLVINGKEYVK